MATLSPRRGTRLYFVRHLPAYVVLHYSCQTDLEMV